MPKHLIFLTALIVFFTFSSCSKKENEEEIEESGFVTFGANYNIINCITNVTIYVDDENIGTLANYTDSISECGDENCITEELAIGEHSYKVEIRPESGSGCSKDVEGTFIISQDECEKIFIDYLEIFNDESECDEDVILSEARYENDSSDSFSITNMRISGDCLFITISSGGCDGSTWEVNLIDSEAIAESYPCQRFLKLTLKNEEECDAVPSREISFNIEDLQLDDYNTVILNISGESITYEY